MKEISEILPLTMKESLTNGYTDLPSCLCHMSWLLRGGSNLSPDTRSECFIRGRKILAENLRGSFSMKNKGVK